MSESRWRVRNSDPVCLAAARCRGATQSLSQQRILNREHLALDIAASHLGAYNPLSSPHARRLSAKHILTQRLVWPSPRFRLCFFFGVWEGKLLMKVSKGEVQTSSSLRGKSRVACSAYASGKIKSYCESAGKLNKRTSAPEVESVQTGAH